MDSIFDSALCDELPDVVAVPRSAHRFGPKALDVEAYERQKTGMGAYWFAAMYQGLPVPAGGAVFKRDDFRYAYMLDDAIVLERPIGEGGPRRVPKSVFRCFQTPTWLLPWLPLRLLCHRDVACIAVE